MPDMYDPFGRERETSAADKAWLAAAVEVMKSENGKIFLAGLLERLGLSRRLLGMGPGELALWDFGERLARIMAQVDAELAWRIYTTSR